MLLSRQPRDYPELVELPDLRWKINVSPGQSQEPLSGFSWLSYSAWDLLGTPGRFHPTSFLVLMSGVFFTRYFLYQAWALGINLQFAVRSVSVGKWEIDGGCSEAVWLNSFALQLLGPDPVCCGFAFPWFLLNVEVTADSQVILKAWLSYPLSWNVAIQGTLCAGVIIWNCINWIGGVASVSFNFWRECWKSLTVQW